MTDAARRRRYRRRHRRHRLGLLAAGTLLWLTAHLPLWLTHALGSGLGRLLWWFPNILRETARDNLVRCLPELTCQQRQRLLRANLRETAKLFLELGPIWDWPRERLLALVDDNTARPVLDRLMASGQGLIVVGPHAGCWELGGLYMAARYPTFTALYRPSRLPVDDYLRRVRSRFGAGLASTDPAGIRQLLAALRRGGCIGILPDQDPGPRGGCFVPFFGQPANTMVLLSRLAIRSRAAVVVCYMERLPCGRGYRLHAHPAPAIAEAPLETSLRAVNSAVESVALALPEQYLWAYRRFRSRPPGPDASAV